MDDKLQQLLHLSADLASIRREGELLSVAGAQIREILSLREVLLYEFRRDSDEWRLRVSSGSPLPGHVPLPSPPELLKSLIRRNVDFEESRDWRADRLSFGKRTLGALLTSRNGRQAGEQALLEPFARILSACWHNLLLASSEQHRRLERERLIGQQGMAFWRSYDSKLYEHHADEGLILRRAFDDDEPSEARRTSYPVTVGEKPVGRVSFTTDAPVSLEEERFVEALLREMGSALDNARLFQTTRVYSELLKASADISRELSVLLDRELLMAEVVALIHRRFGFALVGLLLLDGNAATLQAVAGQGGERLLEDGYGVSINDTGPIGRALRNGLPVAQQQGISLHLESRAPDTRGPAELAGARTQLVLPLRARGSVRGVLDIHSRQEDAFSPSEIAVLEGLAAQVAIAVDNAGLFAQVQDSFLHVKRLYEAGKQLGAATGESSILQVLIDYAGAHAAVDFAFTFAPDPTSAEHLVILNSWSSSGRQLATAEKRWPRSAIGGADQDISAAPLLFTDGQSAKELSKPLQWFLRRFGARATAILPIQTEEGWLASLILARNDQRAFTPEELQPFINLCGQASLAVLNSRLFVRIQATNRRLRELDRLKMRFLASMTHELRTPLNAIIGFSRVMLKGISGPLTAEQEEDLTAILQSGQHLLTLINDLLDMAKIEAGRITLHIEEVDLREIVTETTASVRGLLSDRPITLKAELPESLPPFEADPVRMRQILLNLLSNAAHYTEKGEISCRVQVDEHGKAMLITVSDTGVGIAPEDQKRLFQAFEQAHTTVQTGQGTGLGLPIARHLVQMHHGEIWLESAPQQGSTFFVRLPQRQPDDAANADNNR